MIHRSDIVELVRRRLGHGATVTHAQLVNRAWLVVARAPDGRLLRGEGRTMQACYRDIARRLQEEQAPRADLKECP